MKRLLLASLIIAGCFIATTGNAQVYIHAKIGFGAPVPRVYFPPPPQQTVVYDEPPVYYQQPAYYPQQEYARPIIVGRNDYERVRYYENNYRRNNRDYCERDNRYHDHDRRWKNQRGW
jgi:hypothetical protein